MTGITDRQFDIALRLAVENCFEEEIAEMEAVDPADYPVSRKTKRRFACALNRAMRRDRGFKVPRSLRLIAIAVLLTGTLLFATAMASATVRDAMWSTVVRKYDQYIGLTFKEAEGDAETMEAILPKSLPVGWRIQTIMSAESSVFTQIEAVDGTTMRLMQFFSDNESESMSIDGDPVETREVPIAQGITGWLYTYEDGTVILIWRDRYVFWLSSQDMEIETVIEAAKRLTGK